MEPTKQMKSEQQKISELRTNELSEPLSEEEAKRQIQHLSRRSFLRGGLVIGAGFLGWKWLNRQYTDDGTNWVFRRALQVNEGIVQGTFYSANHLSPTFPRAQAKDPRENGDFGLEEELDADAWRLHLYGLAEGGETTEEGMAMMPPPDASLTLEDIKKLPAVEMTTQLCCIEGWVEVVNWKGAKLSDFIEKYPPVKDENKLIPAYVGIETPDGAYYVGLDRESALHPQTLLCYEMNGKPLTPEHGAPLRLVIPVKYGIKNIKRIGVIRFTSERPKDYWAQQGYDWYAGL